MRIELERILSLLPKKEDGKFVRGAKKEFAERLGYESGDIVSMWISGDSESYLKKLHEISAKYDVSIEWLHGETDEKKPTTQRGGGLSGEAKEILRLFDIASPELRLAALAVLKSAEVADKVQGEKAKGQ